MRTSLLTSIALAGTLVATLAGGCNVMDPALLDRDDGDDAADLDAIGQTDAASVDAASVDAASVDATSVDAASVDATSSPVNLVSNPDFEVNIAGWTTNGGTAVISRSTVRAHTGIGSLLTSMRTESWMAPAVNLTSSVVPGRRYVATAFVRLAQPGLEPFILSVRHTCAGMAPAYNVGNSATSATATYSTWVQPSSTFVVVDSQFCTIVEFVIYIESTSGTSWFYIDDVDVRESP